MDDNDTPRRDPLQPITQPQLPPSAVYLARDMDLPGTVFDVKDSILRRASQSDSQPQKCRVIEICGDLGVESERSRASLREPVRAALPRRAQGAAVVVVDPRGKADLRHSFSPLYIPAQDDRADAGPKGASR